MAISLTYPLAARVAYRKVRSIFAYHANYLIDNKLGIIVDTAGNPGPTVSTRTEPPWQWWSG